MTGSDELRCPCGREAAPWQYTRAILGGKADLACLGCGRRLVVSAARGRPERAMHPAHRGRECWLFTVEEAK
jgi:hypothetical protein